MTVRKRVRSCVGQFHDARCGRCTSTVETPRNRAELTLPLEGIEVPLPQEARHLRVVHRGEAPCQVLDAEHALRVQLGGHLAGPGGDPEGAGDLAQRYGWSDSDHLVRRRTASGRVDTVGLQVGRLDARVGVELVEHLRHRHGRQLVDVPFQPRHHGGGNGSRLLLGQEPSSGTRSVIVGQDRPRRLPWAKPTAAVPGCARAQRRAAPGTHRHGQKRRSGVERHCVRRKCGARHHGRFSGRFLALRSARCGPRVAAPALEGRIVSDVD